MKRMKCPVCSALIDITDETIAFSESNYNTLLTCQECGAGLEYFDNRLNEIEDDF